MLDGHVESHTPGIRGRTRASWHLGARDVLLKLIDEKHPDKGIEPARAALLEVLPGFWDRISKPARPSGNTTLLREAVDFYATCQIQQYIAQWGREHHEDETNSDDQNTHATHVAVVAGTGGDQKLAETQPGAVSARAPFVSAPASPLQIEAMKSGAAMVGRAMLRTYLIEGVPVGEYTIAEGRALAQIRGTESRWLFALCDGGADDQKISAYRSEEEAEKFFKQAAAKAA